MIAGIGCLRVSVMALMDGAAPGRRRANVARVTVAHP